MNDRNSRELEELRRKQAHTRVPGNSVTECTPPISKAVQMAGDYSLYYGRHMSQFMHTHDVMPDGHVAYLDR